MGSVTLHTLLPVLQVAVGPVILISGVGLLLLSMTNRFGRIVDRSRALAHDIREAAPADQARIRSQLQILLRRAHLVRLAITLAGVSLLLAALLVIVLFVTALLGLEIAGVVAALFISCLLALTASLVVFLKDLNLSLVALKLEVAELEKSPFAS